MVEVEEIHTKEGEGDMEEPDVELASNREAQRAQWVRGFDHVLPIDADKGNWCGPVDKLVSLLTRPAAASTRGPCT